MKGQPDVKWKSKVKVLYGAIPVQWRRETNDQVHGCHDDKNFLAPQKYSCSCKTWGRVGGAFDQGLPTFQALTLHSLQYYGNMLLK